MVQKTECSFCFEYFNDDSDHIPKIMKCGDTFCVKCLKSLIIDDKIICPNCKTIITEKIDEMPINKYALDSLKTLICALCLEKYSNKLNSKKIPRILKCGDTFCSECLEESRLNNKNICEYCGKESFEEVGKLIINKCVIEKYENEIILNFKYLDEKKIDIHKIDFSFSIGLIGAGPCGKSSISYYFNTGQSLEESPITTYGIDYHYKYFSCKDKIIKLTLWDTSGIKTFSSLSAES